MRHIIILILSIFCLSAYGQITPPTPPSDVAPMRLVSSSTSRILNQTKFRSYNAVYEHKGSTLSADSGDFYKDDIGNEYFEAHGNIVITQPSGTVIHGTHLHYDATSQHAVLTKNVKMIDGETTLTTNYMTYNLRNQQGTYSGGGRIVGKGDTITSQKAFYFETTKDAYFRNKVVVRTASAIIYTDSLQYNTMYRDAFFFGPTNIKGRKGENLYTEKGTYNTEFGIAKFNKNNLYTEGSRFLKGDSLFYDRNKGIGEAFRNVLFIDTADKFYASGEYGKYLEADQSILMENKPLIKYVVQNDSTKKTQDTTAVDSLSNLEQMSKRERKRLEKEKVEREKEKVVAEKNKTEDKEELKAVLPKPIEEADSVKSLSDNPASNIDTAYMTADRIFSKVIFVRDYKPLDLKLDRNGGQIETDSDVDYGDPEEIDLIKTGDSTFVDSIAKPVKEKIEPEKKVENKEKTIAPKEKPVKQTATDIANIQLTNKSDSLLRKKAIIPTGNEPDSLINKAMTKALTADSIVKDSAEMYSDTARTRIVNAYHNVRVFKSDLQAVADSVYYGMVDSMFRFMGKPMIWSDGSQISADTIFMQIQNGKMDNALLKENAFMVNAVLDSVKFNQLKGRKITAFFANNNIDRLYVDGNAENLIFTVNDKTKIITEMFHDRCSRIKVFMEGKEIIDYKSIRKVDQKIYPFKMVTQENEVLKGFIWKPEDRPKSVADMMARSRTKTADIPDAKENNESEAEGNEAEEKEVKTTDSEKKPTTEKPKEIPNKAPTEVKKTIEKGIDKSLDKKTPVSIK